MSEIRPEWAMVGWQGPDPYGRGDWHWLLASKELKSATLDWVRRTYEFRSWEEFTTPGAFRPAWHIDITGIGKFVLIKGDSYAKCLAELLFIRQWNADTEPGALPVDLETIGVLPSHDQARGYLTAKRAQEIEQ